MSSLKKGVDKILIKNVQHSADHVIKFRISLSEVLLRKTFASLVSISFEYVPLISSPEPGCIRLILKDNRYQVEDHCRQITLKIPDSHYQNFSFYSLGWALSKEKSPWSLIIQTISPTIKFQETIGILKVTPQFLYTNMRPNLQKASVKLMTITNQWEITHDESDDNTEIWTIRDRDEMLLKLD
ncbi:TPA_asm: P3 [Hepatica betacytorhabdovirus 1]|nr:TPA_asm: P3 [Hepatica betacytorhabdovirus 1]